MIRIHSIEHAAAEGAGKIATWAKERGYSLRVTRLDLGESLPVLDSFDFLVVMGGAMNVYQDRDYPWMRRERDFVHAAVDANKALLGVCLGAQLLADALGGRVVQSAEKEIGWQPVRFLHREGVFSRFPKEATVFHWHGDTFDLPPGATRTAESDGCRNQAFILGDRLVGLQFHIEVTPEDVERFVAEGTNESNPTRYVQTPDFIRKNSPDLTRADEGLYHLLDGLAAAVER